MELVDPGVADQADRPGVATEATEWITGLNIEDVYRSREVTSGEEPRVGAEGGGGGGVGEGGGYCGLGLESLGGEDSDGGGVGEGEVMRGCGSKRNGGYGGY